MGFVLGVLAWKVICVLVAESAPAVAASVQEARQMGLVSFTVLQGYDKQQELVAWVLGCLLVPLSAWAIFAALKSTSNTGRRSQPGTVPGAPPVLNLPPWFAELAILGTALGVAARAGGRFIWGANPWGSFGLLGEEGVYLGAVQAMRTGRTLYADIDFPYGPLLIQPLDLWLRIFGDTVPTARAYVLLLHVVGVLVLAKVLKALLGPRRGPWIALGGAVSIAAVAPMLLPNLNGVLLRPVLAFLPAALVFDGARRQGIRSGRLPIEVEGPGGPLIVTAWKDPLLWAGATAVLAGLVSFEIGAAAVAGLLLAAALLRPRGAAWILLPAGASVGALLGLAWLALQGGIPGLIAQMQQMLSLPGLGYQALPYPDALGLFRDGAGQLGAFPPKTAAEWVWAITPPVLIWLGLAVGLCPPRRGPFPSAHAPLLVVAVTSAVLWRAALGRSDLYHLWFYGAVPSVLLVALLLERMWALAAVDFRPLVPTLAALGVLGAVALHPGEEIRFPDAEEVRLARQDSVADPLVPRRLTLDRAGNLQVLPRLGAQMNAIVTRAGKLPKADDVYFYPSEAAYYFLTDRRLPTRFLWAYDAATPAMQRAALDDLNRVQPRWVFRSTDTFPIDWIPQARLAPEIDRYLQGKYRLVEVLPGAELLELARD